MITSDNFPKGGGVYYLIEDSYYQKGKYRSKDMTTEIRLVKKHLSNLLEMLECNGDTDRNHVCRDSRKHKHGYRGMHQSQVKRVRAQSLSQQDTRAYKIPLLGNNMEEVTDQPIPQSVGHSENDVTRNINDLILEVCAEDWNMENAYRLLKEIEEWRDATNKVLESMCRLRIKLNRDRGVAMKTILKMQQMGRGLLQKKEIANAAIALLQNYILDEGRSKNYLHL